MFLGYIDDSADQKHKKVEALAAVMVHDKKFRTLEEVLATTIANIIPDDRIAGFEEFKAWQLYRGCGIFEGIDEKVRFSAIRFLLGTIAHQDFPVIYGAVDLSAIAKTPYASANSTDTSFRLIMPVVTMVMAAQTDKLGPENGLEYALLIGDNTDKNKRVMLGKTFREFRTHMRPPQYGPGAWFIHDEMYFGDSKDSVGLQLADLACYFIRCHLQGDEPEAEEFYQMFENQIIYGKVVPDDSETAAKGINRIPVGNE